MKTKKEIFTGTVTILDYGVEIGKDEKIYHAKKENGEEIDIIAKGKETIDMIDEQINSYKERIRKENIGYV